MSLPVYPAGAVSEESCPPACLCLFELEISVVESPMDPSSVCRPTPEFLPHLPQHLHQHLHPRLHPHHRRHNQNAQEIVAAFDKAIAEMQADGSYDEIVQRHTAGIAKLPQQQ